jgi:hypothetical protein
MTLENLAERVQAIESTKHRGREILGSTSKMIKERPRLIRFARC